jgi:hypothetical protein
MMNQSVSFFMFLLQVKDKNQEMKQEAEHDKY